MRMWKAWLLLSVVAGMAGCGAGSGSGGSTVSTNPTITWSAPAAIAYGTALSSTQLNATTNVPGTFVYTPALGKVLAVGTQTLSVAFTPADTVHYNNASASVTMAVNQATPAITWATPVSVVVNSVLGSTQLDATANVAGTFVYTPAAGTVLSATGSTTLSTTFTPTDTVDYTTATGSVTLSVTGVTNAGTATIDFGTDNQIIRGFGGSTAWEPQLTPAQESALYGNTGGQLGLSILRVRIDPNSTTGGSANWGTELANAQGALAVNPKVTVFATPWTPPVAWKAESASQPYNSSCGIAGQCGGYLNPANYGDYANYLESFVTFMSNGGVNLYAISMQNEPDENVSYESCVWTPAQMDAWVAQNGSTLTTKLIMPESAVFNTAYADQALADPSAVGNIGIVGMHLYMDGTSQGSPFPYANAANNNKEVWMTEHYLTPGGAQPDMNDAIQAAEEMHNSLTVGNYNAYVWWWFVDWNPGGGVFNYGLIDPSNNPTYYGYAVGQYSRFIEPGYVRVNATPPSSPGIYVSAYSGSGHSVIVVINSNASAASLDVVLQNQNVTTMTPYQTTAAGGLAPLTPITVTGDAFTSTLPAESITTFVQ